MTRKPIEKGLFVGGLLAGFGVGAVSCGLIAGASSYFHVEKAAADAHLGWQLMPVVVAAEDLHPGEKLTFEQISQRNVPEMLVTSSVVKPDSASYILNQPLTMPLKAGDLMQWSSIEVPPKGWRGDDPPVFDECKSMYQSVEHPAPVEATAEAIRARVLGGAR